MYTYEKYYKCNRTWAVYDTDGNLICLCKFKRGAKTVTELLNTLAQNK